MINRIRKFNESEIPEISYDRISDINENLTSLVSDLDQKIEFVQSLLNEMDGFKSNSVSNNDQIDDIISDLQLLKKSFSDASGKADDIVTTLKDYAKNGRKFIY